MYNGCGKSVSLPCRHGLDVPQVLEKQAVYRIDVLLGVPILQNQATRYKYVHLQMFIYVRMKGCNLDKL